VFSDDFAFVMYALDKCLLNKSRMHLFGAVDGGLIVPFGKKSQVKNYRSKGVLGNTMYFPSLLLFIVVRTNARPRITRLRNNAHFSFVAFPHF
jgi:hypothetical protein